MLDENTEAYLDNVWQPGGGFEVYELITPNVGLERALANNRRWRGRPNF